MPLAALQPSTVLWQAAQSPSAPDTAMRSAAAHLQPTLVLHMAVVAAAPRTSAIKASHPRRVPCGEAGAPVQLLRAVGQKRIVEGLQRLQREQLESSGRSRQHRTPGHLRGQRSGAATCCVSRFKCCCSTCCRYASVGPARWCVVRWRSPLAGTAEAAAAAAAAAVGRRAQGGAPRASAVHARCHMAACVCDVCVCLKRSVRSEVLQPPGNLESRADRKRSNRVQHSTTAMVTRGTAGDRQGAGDRGRAHGGGGKEAHTTPFPRAIMDKVRVRPLAVNL